MVEHLGTKQVKVSDLGFFPGNAKRGNVGAIRESLREHGQYRPLVVRKTPEGLVVLAGNHTLEALIANGGEKALCSVLSCDDATATKINLADNRTADLGTTDDDALLALLRTLDDLSGTGYAPDDLEDLLALYEPAEMPPGPSGAHYAESPEEEALRREKVASYEPRHGSDGAFTELILVMTLTDRTEAAGLINAVRQRGGDQTAGQIVLDALRAWAPLPADGDADEPAS